jgi:hypothetical protein
VLVNAVAVKDWLIAHGYEASQIVVIPNGDIYILTKNFELNGLRPVVGSARLYRLKQDQWRNSKSSLQTLEFVMTLDFAKLLPKSLLGGRLPTGMDISPDGKRFLVLTYQDAVEFFIDLSTDEADTWKEGRPQNSAQGTRTGEAASFAPNGGLLSTTSKHRTPPS